MDKCSVCHKKPVRYILSYDSKLKCSCKCPCVQKGTMKVCSTKCPQLYWMPVEYLTSKDSKSIEVIYLIEDECNGCGNRIEYEMLLSGTKI